MRKGQSGLGDGSTQPASSAARVIAGRYVLVAELGRGGMGVVWRGQDQVIGRDVAVKELRLPDSGEDAGVFAERVLREVRTGGRLNDPAVVTVYDVVDEANATFIVMELVEAPTLSDLVKQYGPMPPKQAAMVAEQVLSALDAAHRAGIVHRDVKPGNIMVTANGRVKLTDFGIAQAVDDPRLTTSGMLVGSPAFMSPERVAGDEAVPASDLWSLGAVMYFAVEGTVPFERGSTAATLHAIMNEVPYLTRTQGPLASVIMGLLSSTPQGRISAEQAQGLLAMARAGTGMATPPGGQQTIQQTAVYGGRDPTGVGASTLPGPERDGCGVSRGMRTVAVAGGALLVAGVLAAGTMFGHWLGSPAQDEAMLDTMTRGPEGEVSFSYTTRSSGICGVGRFEEGRQISGDNQPDCDEPHDFEVYDSVEALSGVDWSYSDDVVGEYPGEDELAEFAEARCEMTFHSDAIVDEYRGQAKEDVLSYRALTPSRDAWERTDEEGEPDGFHWVACVVTHRDGAQLEERVSRYVE